MQNKFSKFKYLSEFLIDFLPPIDISGGGLCKKNSTRTWKGISGKESYPKLQKQIFDQDYSSFTIENVDAEDAFFITNGYCKKINLTDKAYVGTKKGSTVFFVEQEKDNHFMIPKLTNEWKSFGVNYDGHYDYMSLVLKYTLYDNTLYEGIFCVDYGKMKNYSYGTCVEDTLKSKFMEFYGCLPPWFSQSFSDMICETDNHKETLIPTFSKCMELNDEFRDLFMGREMNWLKD